MTNASYRPVVRRKKGLTLADERCTRASKALLLGQRLPEASLEWRRKQTHEQRNETTFVSKLRHDRDENRVHNLLRVVHHDLSASGLWVHANTCFSLVYDISVYVLFQNLPLF